MTVTFILYVLSLILAIPVMQTYSVWSAYDDLPFSSQLFWAIWLTTSNTFHLFCIVTIVGGIFLHFFPDELFRAIHYMINIAIEESTIDHIYFLIRMNQGLALLANGDGSNHMTEQAAYADRFAAARGLPAAAVEAELPADPTNLENPA